MNILKLKARLFNSLALLVVAAFMSTLAHAQVESQKSPDQVVKDTVNAIVTDIQENRELYQKDKQALFNMVDKTLVPALHIPRMAKLVLGRKVFGKSTDAQRKEFEIEFQAFLINAYAPALLEYTGSETVSYEETDLTTGKDKVNVRASLTAANGQIYPISLYMSNRADTSWRAYNMDIASIDFVVTYRSTFAPILKKEGIDGLIANLREKNAQ